MTKNEVFKHISDLMTYPIVYFVVSDIKTDGLIEIIFFEYNKNVIVNALLKSNILLIDKIIENSPYSNMCLYDLNNIINISI